MTSYRHTFPFVPMDLYGLWEEFNSRNPDGFILGSGSATPADHVTYLSLERPLSRRTSLPAMGGKPDPFPRFVGFLGFDAGRRFDPGLNRRPRRPDPLKTPDIRFVETGSILKIDGLAGTSTLFVAGPDAERRFHRLVRRLAAFRNFSRPAHRSADFRGFSRPPFRRFKAMVNEAKKRISEGDIYQANLSLRFRGRLKRAPIDYYRALNRINPSPYACLLGFDGRWIVSCSPELLLRSEGEKVLTRPIAGTRPRGRSLSADRARKGQLLLSPKERAEHIMLVDLERNDLGKVCRPGSVRVTDRAAVEAYSHVMHIVSQVEGTLSKGRTSVDALKVLFPGGTITGCPKIRSVEIIEELEKESRGPFYGSAGFFCWNGDAVFNILIRTALVQNKTAWIQAGAGIVADSRPEREYKEILAKARALFVAAN